MKYLFKPNKFFVNLQTLFKIKMDEARIGDKNYGDRFRTKSKKKQKKIKKKKVDLTRLDLGDLSKQKGDVFRREEEYLDRFVTFLDMGGTRNYVKG